MEKLKKYLKNDYIYIPIYIIFIIFTMYIVSLIYFDNDGYFIIASGNYILKHGIPKINPFSCVKNLHIIIQQWPWAIYCAFVYNKFGNIALYFSCVGLYILNILAFRQFAKLKNANMQLSTIAIMFVLALSYQFITIRPTLITTLLLILQLCVLEKYKQTDNKIVLIGLVAISFLEINFHSAIWFFHFVFMMPYIVPPIKNPFVAFKNSDMKRLPLIIAMIPMALVGILNPYRIEGIKYILYSYGDKLKNAGISEMQCFKLSGFFGLVIIITTFLVFHQILKHKERTISSEMFYLFCGCTIMGFMYIRNLIYFLFALTCICIEFITFIKEDKFKAFISKQKSYTCMLTWIIVALAISILSSGMMENINEKVQNNATTPTNVITYLESNNVNKNTKIYTTFNNGGFFEFYGYKCFIDARPELYFKKLNKTSDVFDDYLSLEDNKKISTYKKFLKKYDFEYLCIPKNSMFDTYMQSNNDYEVVINSKEYNFYHAK